MKSKIIPLLIIAVLTLPTVSWAVIFVPLANFTVIVNTEDPNSVSHFNLAENNENTVEYRLFHRFNDYQQFDVSTENAFSINLPFLTAFSGSRYYLTQHIEDGLKIKDINCVSDNPAATFFYTFNGVEFAPVGGENITCTFVNVRNRKTPVLIVPGLMGTEMKEGDELLWADIPRMINPLVSDGFMDPLSFNQDLSASNSMVSIADVMRHKTALNKELYDYTNELVLLFINQGYVENQTLFTFPYDWRYGASGKNAEGKTNSDLLGEKIQSIMVQTGSDKVDVVAHSLGGLVVKKYVMDHQADNHIGKAVFVGVPELGSIKSLKVLLLGDSFDISFAGFGLSEDEIKKISENLPAAYDLLPDQQYYNQQGSFVKIIRQAALGIGSTQADLNYQDFENYLTNDHKLNSQALIGAQNLHLASFDNFDMRTAGVDVYAMNGCGSGTLDQIVEKRQTSVLGEITTGYELVSFKDGDNTVSMASSSSLPINQSNLFYALKTKHSDLLSANGSRQEIVSLISGTNLNIDSKIITQDVAKCKITGKVISKHSPINLIATDQNGNQSGVDNDDNEINNIPGASYESFGDQGFLYLPTDDGQIYTVAIKGTGTGTYTITTQDIVDNQSVGGQVFSNLPVTPELSGTINLADQTTLTVRPASGGADQIVTASATLDAAGTQDILPPSSTATVSGSQDADHNYTGDTTVAIAGIDTGSGVLAVHYNLDSAGLQTIAAASATVTVSAEGAHELLFFSTDNAGNNEALQTLTFTIKKPAPPVVVPSPAPVPPASSGGGGSAAASLLLALRQPEPAPVALPLPPQPAPPLVEDEKLITPPAPLNPAPVAVRKRLAPTVAAAVAVELKKPAPPAPPVPPAPAKETPSIFLASLKVVGDWIAKLLFGR